MEKNMERADTFDLTLLANFIHQVVNPLGGIAGTIDNIIEGKVQPESRARQRLVSARAQLEQCTSLIRNLAYFAQGFAPLKDADAESINVPQIIIEAAQFFQEQAAKKKMRIDLIERYEQNKLRGQPDLVRQVFMNLFDNAVKYSKDGTRAEVHQRIQPKTGKLLVTVSSISRYLVDASEIPKLFEVGFRGANAKQIIASGTGLGLHITKKIVEDVHEGKIWVESQRDGTITFFLQLPVGE